MKKIMIILGILFILSLVVFIIIDPDGQVKRERNLYQKIELAEQKANKEKERVFCEEYRKLVFSKDQAPFAYKRCF